MAVRTWPVDLRHPALIYFLEKAFQPELADPKHQLISQISVLLCICCTFQHRKKMSDPARSHFLPQIGFILTRVITPNGDTILFYFLPVMCLQVSCIVVCLRGVNKFPRHPITAYLQSTMPYTHWVVFVQSSCSRNAFAF